MLNLKNNLLSSTLKTIETPDCIFQLTTDIIDCNYFGILTLNNNIIKTIQFIKFNNTFKARLSLAEEDLKYLTEASFKVLSVSAGFTKESNSIPIVFDVSKIKLSIKQSASKELSELKTQIASLESKLNTLSLGKLVPNVNIANKDYIKPGMILVAIDNGNFMAAYPFADIIKIVNGQHAVDGVVEIDASMIKYTTERTIEQQLKVIGDAIKNQSITVKTLAGELKTLSEKVANLSVKIETHLDSGIV